MQLEKAVEILPDIEKWSRNSNTMFASYSPLQNMGMLGL